MTTSNSIDRAPRRPETMPVPVRFTKEEIEQADRYAAKENRSRSSFIRVIYLLGLQHYEKQSQANCSESAE